MTHPSDISPADSASGAPASGAVDPDVRSIDAVVRAIYEVISGPAGARDWDRDRKLFLPGARLLPSGASPAGGRAEVLDIEGYIASRAPFFEANSFYESEVARKTFRFGAIAHVLSAYEGRRTPSGVPFLRGINSFQLFFDGGRWWILSIAWDNEGPHNSTPMPDLSGSDVEPVPGTVRRRMTAPADAKRTRLRPRR